MRQKHLFILSLVVILLLSWANVDFFGSSFKNHFPPAVNQVVHFVALLITATLGYINWKDRERWLSWLWRGMYLVVIVAFLLLSAAYYVSHVTVCKHMASILRNSFTSPLPLLVFYLFDRLSAQFKNAGESGKSE